MTLCPGCNQGRLEPLTAGLRRHLKIADPTIRSVCTMDCGAVGRYHAGDALTKRMPIPLANIQAIGSVESDQGLTPVPGVEKEA